MAHGVGTEHSDTFRGEGEQALIERAQVALSQCRWTVGECAAQWTKRYARGRTDVDFGLLIGLTGDQVFQRRRVWETFADVYTQYPHLKWSHFYAALTWDDAAECLQWANELQATVAEMRAWRKAQRGEDLLSEAGDELALLTASAAGTLAAEQAYVHDPDAATAASGAASRSGSSRAEHDSSLVVSGVARDYDAAGAEYAPFRSDALQLPSSEPPTARPGAPAPLTPEQLVKRLCHTLERCDKAWTEEVAAAWGEVPAKLRQRLLQAVRSLARKADEVDRG